MRSSCIRHILRPCILVAIVIGIVPSTCFAQIPGGFTEFVVHGNFDIVAKAFQRIGLIASDGGYQSLFFTIAILLLVIGAFDLLMKGFGGNQATPWAALILRFVVGLALYAVFVVNTSTFIVRDETANKFITVSNIPDGIAAIALIGNKIEQGLIAIIETSAAPHNYGRGFTENPFGLVFDLTSKVWGGDANIMGQAGTDATGTLNKTNIHQFIMDCFLFELDRPGTPVSVDDLNTANDLIPIIANGSNAAVWTTYYNDANKAGQAINCADAWARINAYLTGLTDASATVTRFYEEKCSEAGFAERVVGAVGPNIVDICKAKVAGLISNEILGANVSSSTIFKNVLVSKELHKVFMQESPSMAMKVLGDYQTAGHKITQGIIASEWIPYLKTVLYVVFLGISPFIIILVASPWPAKPLMVLIGMSVFFICWSVTNAILHESAMDAALDALRDITSGNMGYRSQLLLHAESLKAAASFAPYQLLAFMVAGSISAALVGFGGNALSRMGVSESESLKREGQTSANRVAEPSGAATTMEGFTNSVPTMAMHNRYGYDGMRGHKALEVGSYHGAAHSMIGRFGGVAGASDTLAQNREFGVHGEAAKRAQLTSQFGTQSMATHHMGHAEGARIRTGSARFESVNDVAQISGVSGQQAENFMAFVAGAQKMGTASAFASAGINQKGIMTLARSMAELNTGQKWGQLMKAMHRGHNPFGYGEQSGAMAVIKDLADIEAAKTIGEGNFAAGIQKGRFRESVSALTKDAISQINSSGQQSGFNRKQMKRISQSSDTGAGLTRSIPISVNLTPENKAHWAPHLSKWNGQTVKPHEIPDSGVLSGSAYVDQNTGQLTIGRWEIAAGNETAISQDKQSISGGKSIAGSALLADFHSAVPFAQSTQRIFNAANSRAQMDENALAFIKGISQELGHYATHTGDGSVSSKGSGMVTTLGKGVIPGASVDFSVSSKENQIQNLRANTYWGFYQRAIADNTSADGDLTSRQAAASQFREDVADQFKHDLSSLSLSQRSFGGGALFYRGGEETLRRKIAGGRWKQTEDGVMNAENGVVMKENGHTESAENLSNRKHRERGYRINEDGSTGRKTR